MQGIETAQCQVHDEESGGKIQVLTTQMKFWISGLTGKLVFKSPVTGVFHTRGTVPTELKTMFGRPYQPIILPCTFDCLEEGEPWPFGIVHDDKLIELA